MAPLHDHNLFVAAPLPVAELGTAERLACVRLIRPENVGPVTFRALVNHFGGAEAALAAVPELSRRGGRARPIRLCPADKAEAELERAEQVGAVPLFTIEPGYPAALVYLFVAIRCRPVACILCLKNKMLLFQHVRAGSLSAAQFVATALRRRDEPKG